MYFVNCILGKRFTLNGVLFAKKISNENNGTHREKRERYLNTTQYNEIQKKKKINKPFII